MKVRSFSQQQRFVAISFALALACAIPMLVAETADDDHENIDPDWEAWAWVRNDGISNFGGTLVSNSAHQYSVWNKHTIKLQFDIEYHHSVENENTGVIVENMTDEFKLDVEAGQLVTSSTVYISGDYVADPAVYTFSAYTAARKGSGAVTRTLTDDIEVQ